MAKEDRIGVVTVTYNSASVLSDFLQSLAAQTHSNLLFFAVDNASQDETRHLLDQWHDERLRVIANPDNRGVAEGNNQGIRAALAAGCTSVLLINNDTAFEPKLIERLDAGIDAHSVQMACPKMVYFDEPERIWVAGGDLRSWHGYISALHGAGEIDRGQHDRIRLVTDVPTCCVLIRSVVFERIGLMDPRYFVYFDDTDFMYRAHRADFKMIYLPAATLRHRVSVLTGGADSPFALRYYTRNQIYFLLKHFGIVLTVPWIVLCQILWAERVLSGRRAKSWYRIKQSALRESLSLWWHNKSTLHKNCILPHIDPTREEDSRQCQSKTIL